MPFLMTVDAIVKVDAKKEPIFPTLSDDMRDNGNDRLRKGNLLRRQRDLFHVTKIHVDVRNKYITRDFGLLLLL